MMKKTLVAGIAGLLLACGMGVAHAGTSRRGEIRMSGNQVWGVPRHARESRDALQYINCGIRQIGSQEAFPYCYARDASGRSIGCTFASSTSGNAGQAQAFSAIGPDSSIYFEATNYGRCLQVDVSNDSRNLDGPTAGYTVSGMAY